VFSLTMNVRVMVSFAQGPPHEPLSWVLTENVSFACLGFGFLPQLGEASTASKADIPNKSVTMVSKRLKAFLL
jgi:hypothetical protein